MHDDPFVTIKKYIDQPSGSYDKKDVEAVAGLIAADLKSLGFDTAVIPGVNAGPVITGTLGHGSKSLLFIGHMDTVFPHDMSVPYIEREDGTVLGSGIIDMKGGIAVMLYSIKEALPSVDPEKYTLRVVINGDEEIGSEESRDVIIENARKSFAALSYEPAGSWGRIISARKGVTSLEIICHGKAGHAGNAYLTSASAIQALCAHITRLYSIRDDEKEISFNAGVISGGQADNVVAAEAHCRCEFRYFNPEYYQQIKEKILEILSAEPVEGVKTEVRFLASHPSIDNNEKTQAIIDLVQEIGRKQGRDIPAEKAGGAGDISFVGTTGIGVVDGLGLYGEGMHTTGEFCRKESVAKQISLSAELIKALCC